MADERWQQTLDLFFQAVELEGESRESLLDEACAGDEELRREVERLLFGHGNAPALLDAPEGLGLPFVSKDWVGRRLGPYHLEEILGEGGMGVVYRARQEAPIQRTVALKLIPPDMATPDTVARFEAERQTLALLDHPHVARVFDAGASEEGQPYFAMELVDGEPITGFCDRHRLDLVQRLELFSKVCRAVHHAHQKGILHRDLKPSNVLVAEIDGEGAPKVIDFGVARAVSPGPGLTELAPAGSGPEEPRGPRTGSEVPLNRRGGLVGTPEYMSPEQAQGALDIDIRADVYSLGVLLHELLVGGLPGAGVRRAGEASSGWDSAFPDGGTEPPSLRVGRLGKAAERIAEDRRTERRTLARDLRGDLDWIVLRALERERSRRYGTASELAEDLRRHLEDEPVSAGPPELGYRLGKFIKRHRIAVVAATVIGALLVTFSALTSWQSLQLRRALDKSEREARKAAEVTEFLTELFEVSDPGEALGNEVPAREILDRGADRIASELGGQPEIQAALMGTIGEIYLNLGLSKEGESLILQSLEVQRQALGPAHGELAAGHARLARLRQWQDRLAEAETEARRALELHGGDGKAVEAGYRVLLGSILNDAGRLEEAEAMLRRVLEAEDGPPEAGSLEAADLGLEQIAALGALSQTLRFAGRFPEAEALLQRAVALAEERWGRDHPETTVHLLNLAGLLADLDRNGEAEALQEEVLDIRRRVYGDEHVEVAVAMNNLARVYQRQGRLEESEALHREVLELRHRLQGDAHSDVAVALSNLGVTLRLQGRNEEAEALYREALEVHRRVLGTDHPTVAIAHHNLASVLLRLGRLEDAEAEMLRTLDIRLAAFGAEHPQVAQGQAGLGKILVDSRRFLEAEPLLRSAWAIQQKTLPPRHRRILSTEVTLGECLTGLGRFEEAEALLRKSLEGLEEVRGAENAVTLAAVRALGRLYVAWGKPETAAPFQARLAQASVEP
ncbi:MAG: serine/threonine-protein kinase [Acidobacteriota bacterium]